MATQKLFIVAAKRTPFGAFGGKLKNQSATELAAHASKAALAAGKVDPNLIDSVIFGSVAQTSADAPYLARHVALKAGVPADRTAFVVNRLCGSGFQAVINGAHEILLGEAQVVLVGGAESMSQAPMSVYGHNIRWGTTLGADTKMVDTLWAALTDSHIKTPMGITAENLAAKYNISRADCDAYGLRSQQAWAKANAAGVFNAEIAPVDLAGKKGPEKFSTDEGPRPETTLEGLAKLKPVFKPDGVVTAGGASGITDGAAALIVASEEAVKKHGFTPLARIVSWGITGCPPEIMGIGPVNAIKQALSRAKLNLSQMDLVEVNEAFAAQYLAVEKELGLKRDITNASGGAIALGHPLGASGARITGHLANRLAAGHGKYAVGSACIGGGQGIAIVLERA